MLDEVIEAEDMDEEDEERMDTGNYASLIGTAGQATSSMATQTSLSPQRARAMLESKKRERGLTVSSTGSKEGIHEAPSTVRSPSASHEVCISAHLLTTASITHIHAERQVKRKKISPDLPNLHRTSATATATSSATADMHHLPFKLPAKRT